MSNSFKFRELWVFVLLLAGCTQSSPVNDEEEMLRSRPLVEENDVEVIVLSEGVFYREVLSNGKLKAKQKITLRFRVGGTVSGVFRQAGESVAKGQVLARLDTGELLQKLEGAELAYKKAELELEDMMVGRGYDIRKRDEIPESLFEMAAIRSGYAEADNQLRNIQGDMESAILRAPFSGKVADVKAKRYEMVGSGEECLTLIDDRMFEVEFYLIESEIRDVEIGSEVNVEDFITGEVYKGKIESINPKVDENGMVLVKAALANEGSLMEGMNVKVRVRKAVDDQLIVPKEAVLIRDNQEVLFKYQGGRAYWTYVLTTGENSQSYTVEAHPEKKSASLHSGDTVIVSGNIHLAHDSEVKIKKDKSN